MGETTSKTIRCTEANAAEFQALVRRWPDLQGLVRALQAQDLFPGLRAMQVTLTGSAAWVAQGLAVVAASATPADVEAINAD